MSALMLPYPPLDIASISLPKFCPCTCSKGHCFSSCASAAARRAGQRDTAELGSVAQEGTSHDHTAQTPANPPPKFMGSVKKLMGGDTGSGQVRGTTLQMISCLSGGKSEPVSPFPEGSSCSSTHLKGWDWLAFRAFLDMDTSWPGMGWDQLSQDGQQQPH